MNIQNRIISFAEAYAKSNGVSVDSFEDHDCVFFKVGRNSIADFYLANNGRETTCLAIYHDTGEWVYSQVNNIDNCYFGHH